LHSSHSHPYPPVMAFITGHWIWDQDAVLKHWPVMGRSTQEEVIFSNFVLWHIFIYIMCTVCYKLYFLNIFLFCGACAHTLFFFCYLLTCFCFVVEVHIFLVLLCDTCILMLCFYFVIHIHRFYAVD